MSREPTKSHSCCHLSLRRRRRAATALRVWESDRFGIAREARDPLDGLLRVGAIFTVAPYLFPRLVPVLHASAPRMPLVIEENYTERLRKRLAQGELDAIIVLGANS